MSGFWKDGEVNVPYTIEETRLAAAPDMLEALNAIIRLCELPPFDETGRLASIASLSRAAITKAGGES